MAKQSVTHGRMDTRIPITVRASNCAMICVKSSSTCTEYTQHMIPAFRVCDDPAVRTALILPVSTPGCVALNLVLYCVVSPVLARHD